MFLEEFNNTSSPFWTLSDDLAFFKFLSLKKVHYWVEVLKKKLEITFVLLNWSPP